MAEALDYRRWPQAERPIWEVRWTDAGVGIFDVSSGAEIWEARVRRMSWARVAMWVVLIVGIAASAVAWMYAAWHSQRGGVMDGWLTFGFVGGMVLQAITGASLDRRTTFEEVAAGAGSFQLGLNSWGWRRIVVWEGEGPRRWPATVRRRQVNSIMAQRYEWILTVRDGPRFRLRQDASARQKGAAWVLRMDGGEASVASIWVETSRVVRDSRCALEANERVFEALDRRCVAALLAATFLGPG